jgi:succinoglycan biosynthesis transport protein ExoP
LEFATYISIARRWWWTLLVSTWVAGLAGFILGSQIPPTYESRVRVLVGPVNADLNTIRASGSLVLTYAELAVSRPLIESTITELGLNLDPSVLRQQIRTTANDSTRFLTVTVRDGDPKQAAALANGLVGELVQFAAQGTSRPEGEVTVTDFAEAPTSPASPDVPLIVVMAAAAGLLGALVIVVFLEHLNPTVSTVGDLTGTVGVPVLASIDRAHVSAAGGTAVMGPVRSEMQLLATRIRFGEGGKEHGVIGIVGTSRADGSAELISALAASFAAAGLRPLIVDANSGERRLTSFADAVGQAGLADQLVDSDVNPVPTKNDDTGVFVLGHGTYRLDSPVVESRLGPLLKGLNRDHGIVLVHIDPGLSASAVAVARACEGVAVAVRATSVRPAAVERAVNVLESAGVTVLGAVLHNLRPRRVPAGTYPPLEIAEPVARVPKTQPGRAARSSRPRGRRAQEQTGRPSDTGPIETFTDTQPRLAEEGPGTIVPPVPRVRESRRTIPRTEPE